MTDLPADPTVDEIRIALAPLVARNAAFDGWHNQAVEMAAGQAGVNPDIARLAFSGPVDMVDAWFAHIDAEMRTACPPEQLSNLSIRGRIEALVLARLTHLHRNREALRRALAILAMPTNIARAAQLGWRSADAMWRAIGDTSVDFNYYSKRATLTALYSSTLLAFLNDESEDFADTRAFLARRIQSVLKVEKAKAQWRARGEHRPSLARFVGRLRYRAR